MSHTLINCTCKNRLGFSLLPLTLIPQYIKRFNWSKTRQNKWNLKTKQWNPGWLYIDRCIIITKKANLIKETQVIPHSISDLELIIFATLQLKKPHPKPVYITTRSFKNYIKDAFLEDISNAPWLILDTFDNVEDFRSTYTSENCYPTPFIDDN